MADPLLRFQKPLDPDHLVGVLEGASWPTERLPSRVPAEPVRGVIATLDPSLEGSAIDLALVEPLHRGLEGLTPREAADMRFWHYLAGKEFPDLVWLRWTGATPPPGTLKDAMTTSLAKRFLGHSSLNGVSRNTFARLWWTAHHLRDGEDYDLARQALSNQDMFQAIFERFFGIYPAAAHACLASFEPHGEAERRRAARWLQQCLSTTVLEALSGDEIEQIVNEALAASDQ